LKAHLLLGRVKIVFWIITPGTGPVWGKVQEVSVFASTVSSLSGNILHKSIGGLVIVLFIISTGVDYDGWFKISDNCP